MERMRFDDFTNRWYLTEQALLDAGVNIRARFVDAGIGDGGEGVNALLNDATNIVYNYAHECVFNTAKQDYILAHNEEVRAGLFRALLAMAVSLARYGNRLDSVDEGERAVAIPEAVKAEFNIVYPSIGHTLNYAGRW